MSNMSFMEKLLDGVEIYWEPLDKVFNIYAGGDVPTDALSDIETEEFNIPILSNGIGDKSLYGWTNQAKIEKPSLTISARGTIGWTSYRDRPFFPIVRLLVLTPKVELNLKYAYHFMKMIENNYKVAPAGIPQLTKPMLKNVVIPIPCPDNPEKSLAIQSEIVRILDKFTALTAELTAELNMRKKQYNYYRDKLLSFEEGEVEWKTLGEVFNIFAGGDKPKNAFSEEETDEFNVPILSNGIGLKSLYGWTNSPKITEPSLTVSARGTIGWTSYRDRPFFPIIRLLVLTPKIGVNTKYAYYYMKTIENNYPVPPAGIPQLTKPMIENVKFPIPYPNDPERSQAEQARIVAILDKFDALTSSITEGLPREIELRQKQYKYYRDLLLSFPKSDEAA
ncbi:restriction endonuclease subunit S [Proteus mirabilis]|uniref:restriction endonuclease subunit S n=1 Tax=Proteus TaxID=583 RepID=UPI0021D7BDE2|nr:restriction endonuclease subunit S [Proteus mirabilis]EME2730135.1 restriction endonuclease subunit S [Proteus mirabilis]MCU9563874.1 restriction endonuclease subunit S [Proteus mirabilis]UZE64914.1 restriction endonuclease subunit S [Proteus mirabilis]